LSEEQIWQIRERVAAGDESQEEIGRRFNVAGQTISNIKCGKSWSWLTGPGVGKATEEYCRPKEFTGKSLVEIWAEACKVETEEERLAKMKEMLLEKRVIDAKGCWLLRNRTPDQHPNFRYGKKHFGANRIAFQIWKGPIAEGMKVCCRYGQRGCFNPD